MPCRCSEADPSTLLTTVRRVVAGLGAALALAYAAHALAAADDTALAKASQNPVASLISLPFENNFNGEWGPNNSNQNVLNVKPVIPVQIGDKVNLINRAIVPFVSQPGVPGGPNRKAGLGDTTYQAFFSSQNPGKWILGAGPQIQIPTHTSEELGNENWGAGPAFVALTMPGRWVIGALVAHMWDIAASSNDGSEADISNTVIQPFVNYNFPEGWYLTTTPVITANWEADNNDKWTIPLGGGVGRVFRIGTQPLNMRMAYYYNAAKPRFGAQWDLQLTLTLLFPK